MGSKDFYKTLGKKAKSRFICTIFEGDSYYKSKELKIMARSGIELNSYLDKSKYRVDFFDYDARLIKKFKKLEENIYKLKEIWENFDINFTNDFIESLWNELESGLEYDNYDFILGSLPKISGLYTVKTQINLSLILLKKIKEKFPSSKIIIGGDGYNFEKREMFDSYDFIELVWNKRIDSETLNKLLEKYPKNKNINPIHRMPNFPPSIPIPPKNHKDLKYSYEEIFNFYDLEIPEKKEGYIKQAELALVEGCIGACAFCQNAPTKYEELSLSRMSDLIYKYIDLGFNSFMMIHPCINKIAEKFCNFIKRNNLNFYWSSDSIHSLSKDYYDMLYEAGCRKLHFGIETVDDKILKYVNKKFNVEKMTKSLRLSHEAGIWNAVSIITDLPYSKEDNHIETGKYIKDNSDIIQYIYVNKFHLIPYTFFHLNPKKYKVKCINQIPMVSCLHKWKAVDTDNYYSIKQLIWRETKGRGFGEVQKLIKRNTFPPQLTNTKVTVDINTHLLFALYDIVGNKKEVYDWIDKYYFSKIMD